MICRHSIYSFLWKKTPRLPCRFLDFGATLENIYLMPNIFGVEQCLEQLKDKESRSPDNRIGIKLWLNKKTFHAGFGVLLATITSKEFLMFLIQGM